MKSGITKTFNDENLLALFYRAAETMPVNKFYLSEYANNLSTLFRDGMKQATATETKEAMVATLANVIEYLGHVSTDAKGVSHTLNDQADTSALKRLSATLFKHGDLAHLPEDFATNISEVAQHLKLLAQGQNVVAKGVLENKAEVLDKIAARAKAVPAQATGLKALAKKLTGLKK